MQGAVSYTWNSFSKEEISEGGYVYSWVDQMKPSNPVKPWEIEINQQNFMTGSLLVQCQGKSGYGDDLIAEILWVITRLHSPLGFPTDPLVCKGMSGYQSCNRLRPHFRIECNPDDGDSYRGSVSQSRAGRKCRDWNNVRIGNTHEGTNGQFFGMANKYREKRAWGEHNYCRKWIHREDIQAPQCFVRTSTARRIREVCDIPSCSNCMYGTGNGFVPRYLLRFPRYSGSGIDTLKRYETAKKVKFRKCYRTMKHLFWFHENLCRHQLEIRGRKFPKTATPSCLVYKGDSTIEEPLDHADMKKLEIARCRIRQCTVRIVWFMFFDENGQLIVDGMSSL